MKSILALLLFTALVAMAAEVSPIRMRVEQVSKDQHATFTHKQGKSLKIELSNGSAQDVKGLKVKYAYFARNVKTSDMVEVRQGELSADVKAHGSVTIEAPAVSVAYTDEHAEGNPFNNRGQSGKNRGMGHVKTVPSSGQRYVGYRVEVFSDGARIAESSSEPSLKAKAGN